MSSIAMGSENPSSPNAIPARSSSAGLSHHHGNSHNHAHHQPSKSVLRPLPEESWISPKARQAAPRPLSLSNPQLPQLTPLPPLTPPHPLPSPLQLTQATQPTPPTQFTQPPQPQLLHRSSSIGKTHSKHLSAEENSLAYRTLTGKVKQPATIMATAWTGAGGGAGAMAGAGAVTTAAPTATARTSTAAPPGGSGGGGRRGDRRWAGEDNGEWTSEKERIVLGPFEYLENHPGKDIRTALIHAFDDFLKVPPASLAVITRVIGMLHTSSLLIDDVQDNSILRRGVPVAHNIFGTAQTINSANYVYFLALQEVQKLRHRDEAIEIFTSELLNLHRGQGMDLYWRDTLTCPTEDDYLEMVQNKTGGLFRLAVRLMQAESVERGRLDCVPLANLMGLVFQICDDHLNLRSTLYTQNKGLCEDLTEGKFSFPIIHAIRSNTSNLQLINILKLKTTDDQVKKYAVQYMQSVGSFDYSRKVIRELKAKAVKLIAEMDAGSGRGDQVRRILDRMDVD